MHVSRKIVNNKVRNKPNNKNQRLTHNRATFAWKHNFSQNNRIPMLRISLTWTNLIRFPLSQICFIFLHFFPANKNFPSSFAGRFGISLWIYTIPLFRIEAGRSKVSSFHEFIVRIMTVPCDSRSERGSLAISMQRELR